MLLYLISAVVIFALLCVFTRRQAADFRSSAGSRNKELRSDRFAGILFLCLAFFNLLLPDQWGQRIEQAEFAATAADPFHALLRLLNAALIASLPIALMYRKKNIARFCAAAGVLSFFLDLTFADTWLSYFLSCPESLFGELLDPLMYSKVFRLSFFYFLETLKLYLVLRVFFKRKELMPVKGFRDLSGACLMAVPLLLVNMQPSFPGELLHSTLPGIVLSSMNSVCLIWMLFIPAEIAVLALIFRKRSEEDRHILIFMMSIGLLFRYSAFYRCSVPMDAGRFPLQLCNVACYLIPAAVFFRRKGLALFAATINTFGALAAVIVCDTPGDSGLLYFLNVHYILEHNGIIVISILVFILKIFPPVEKKDFRAVMRVLTHYVATVFIVGTLLNWLAGFIEDPGMLTCNYLFLFERDFVEGLLPSAGIIFDIGFELGPYCRVSLSVVFAYVLLTAVGGLLFLLFRALFGTGKSRGQG